jgi:hypothetical protein
MTNPNGKRPWTAGPWTKGHDGFLYGANKELVVEKGSGLALRCGNASAKEIANGHLIRAAPELFEALIEAKAELEAFGSDVLGEDYNNPKINRALAKALGAEQ